MNVPSWITLFAQKSLSTTSSGFSPPIAWPTADLQKRENDAENVCTHV